MLEPVLRLAELLREDDLEVSTGEVLDALAVVGNVDLLDHVQLREGLRAAMVKRADRDGVFDRCFAVAFELGAAAVRRREANGRGTLDGSRPPRPVPDGGIPAAVLAALLAGDDDALAALAELAVDTYGGFDGSAGSLKHVMHRVLRAIDLSRMLSAAMQQLRREGDLDELALMLERAELTARLDQFRQRLAATIGDRRSADAPDVAIPGRARLEDLDVMELSRTELDEVRRLVRPLVRRLATRVARRRRSRQRGRVDLRRTMRRSLQTGGVPIEVVMRRRHPHRPEIVLLCDLSGSVAEFATFTLTIVNAIHAEVRRVRSFAFVDGIAEVSDLFDAARFEIPVSRLVERAGVIGADGHSDYGRVFGLFVDRHLDDVVDHRTTVVITGDARGNRRDGGVAALARIHDRARRVFWLNPEPEVSWSTGDSLIEEYRGHCTSIHEVRSLGQLADSIAALL
ncbi:MAG: hypothetical protein JWM12_3790 [Ilumatobacteraceae bacterium]|nr:hypothetical protein [Ilumatobacteraceae bacterium]